MQIRRDSLLFQIASFGTIGVIGLGADTAALYSFTALLKGLAGLFPALSSLTTDPVALFAACRILSFLVAATVTWFLNRTFTFAGDHQGSILRQWAHFIAANAAGGLINYTVSVASVRYWPVVTEHQFLAVALGSVAGMVLNFLASKHLVFRKNQD